MIIDEKPIHTQYRYDLIQALRSNRLSQVEREKIYNEYYKATNKKIKKVELKEEKEETFNIKEWEKDNNRLLDYYDNFYQF